MGCGSSKLKGDEMADLASPPPPTKPSTSNKSPISTSISSVPLPTNTTTAPTTRPHLPSNQTTNNTNNNNFQSTYTHTISSPEQEPPQPKQQSLSQRWKERKRGVPEPKDENGRGLYTGKTTDELVKMGASQVVDGRVVTGGIGCMVRKGEMAGEGEIWIFLGFVLWFV